jgi:hypothetical protein
VSILRIAFTSLLVLLYAACDSPRSFVDAHELAVAAQQIESIAHEAAWLARELRARHVSAEMAWVHQQALAEDANKAMQVMARPVPAELRAQQETIAKLAAQLQADVTRIAPAVNHPGELDALHGGFESLAQAMHPMAGPA